MGDLIFKGCTRPAMLWGVPLIPLMVASFPLVIIGFWGLWLFPLGGIFSFAMIVPIFFIMKFISKADDQRLMQYMLKLKMSLRHRNSTFWGAKSYAPFNFKKRHDE